jgi:hypothetical protein
LPNESALFGFSIGTNRDMYADVIDEPKRLLSECVF